MITVCLCEQHLARATVAAHIPKINSEPCKNEFCEFVFENQLRSQTHIKNLNRGHLEWKMIEICNFVIRSSFWDRRRRSKNHIVQ